MAAVAITFALPFFASAQRAGQVYIDQNLNGKLDPKEQTLAGVSVSDGLNVVKTNAKGIYELPANEKARFISVTSPSGTRPVTNHYTPVNDKNDGYDFGLTKSNIAANSSFDIIHIADTETSNYREWIDNLKEYTAANPTAFIIHTGDICYQPGLDFHGINVRTAQMGVPMYYTVGNHDLVDGKYGEELFESHFGPSWHSWEVGNVHFIALPMLGGDRAPSYTRSQILKWIKNDLAKTDPSKKVVMFNHDLWFQGNDLIFRAGKTGTPEADSIDMSRHNLVAFIYGHWHSQYARRIGGALTICSGDPDKGGIDHSPANFRLISFDQSGNLSGKNSARYTRIDGIGTSAYPADGDSVSTQPGAMNVIVNAYRTASPTASVRVGIKEPYSASPAKWITLKPASDWTWSGSVPVSGKGGRHLVVETIFKDGSRIVENRKFTLTDKVAPTVKPTGNWTNLGGDAAHTSVVFANDSAKGAAAPQLAWSMNTGSNIYMCSPVIGDGRLFIATQDDDNLEKCNVVAFDAATGRQLWRYKLNNSVKGSIVYDNGVVIAADGSHRVYAIDGASGKLRWEQQLAEFILPINLHGLAVQDGVVYAGQSGSFTALDSKTGTILWKNRAWSGGEGSTSTVTVGSGAVLASGHWNGLFAHNVKDGSVMWKKQDSDIRFRDGSATYYDGNFYLASSSGLFIINPISGDVLKTIKVDGVNFNAASAPIVTPKAVYVATSDKGIMAFDRLTFKRLWNFGTSPAIFYSVPYTQDYQCSVETTPLLIGRTLVFGASDGYLYGIDSETGRFTWRRRMGAPIFSSPAVSGDAMYIADFAGNIYCFKI